MDKRLSRAFWLCVGFFVFGIVTQHYAYEIQENFYTATNELLPYYLAAGPLQLSLTSATIVFEAIGESVGMMLFFCLIGGASFTPGIERATYLTFLSELAVYYCYEGWQYFHPKYVDNNMTDVAMATLATGIMTLSIFLITRSKRSRKK